MGTKLKGAINPLPTTQNNNLSFTVHFVDDYFRTRPVKENCSMERVVEKEHMESIKKTMQMHENIFKHQVRELHRLYSVQKILMDELKKEIKRSQFVNQQHLTTTQTKRGNNFDIVRADPSSRERSGSCSGGEYTMKIVKGFDLEMQPGEDIYAEASAVEEDQQAGPSVTNCRDFSQSSRLVVCSSGSHADRDISSLMNYSRVQMNTEVSDEDSEVELTLSIGGSSSSKKILDSSASFKSERGGEETTTLAFPRFKHK